MDNADLYKRVLTICRENNQAVPDDPDVLLIDSGLIDSFGAFMIMSSLEIEYDIEISDDDMKYDNFKNISSIMALVTRLTLSLIHI